MPGSGLCLLARHVFEIKFIEMGEPAIPAPDSKVPAADGHVVDAGDMAVPAFSRLDKIPEIVTANLRERSFFTDILDPGYENTGSPAVVADHLRLEGHSSDNLVGCLLTMITVCAVPRGDEPFAHGR
jgi:hypothetical protein